MDLAGSSSVRLDRAWNRAPRCPSFLLDRPSVTVRRTGARRRTSERMGSGRATALVSLGLLFCITPLRCVYADTETVLPVRAFSGLAVDERHRHVFISQGDSITVVDFDGHIVTSIENQPGAAGMLVDSAHGVLYVALSGADAVSEINTKTLAETQRRSLGLGVCPWTLAVAHRLLWFGFTCSNNACPSCTRQPQVGGIGSLDPRRGDIVDYDGFTSGFGVPLYFPLVASTHRVRNKLIAAEGGLEPTEFYRYSLLPDGRLHPEVQVFASDECFTLDVAIEPDGRRIVTGALVASCQTERVAGLRVYAVADFSYELSYVTRLSPVVAVAISSDGQLVAGAGGFSYIFIFASGDSNPIGVYDFSSDGWSSFERGLAFDRKADKLFAVGENSTSFTLRILDDPRHPLPTMTTTTTTTTTSSTSTSTSTTQPPCTFVLAWGVRTGSGNGELISPWGVATDGSGNVYVADTGNSRIQKFDATGTFLAAWGSSSPTGVATDGSGNIYVADGSNNRIQKFDATGNLLTAWGTYGSGNGQFYSPAGVATDASGNVYVVDTGNYRIQKFDATGTFLSRWGTYGSGNGQFIDPIGVATDRGGNVYVTDGNYGNNHTQGNNRIQKFDATGTFLTAWGTYGSGNGQFANPT